MPYFFNVRILARTDIFDKAREFRRFFDNMNNEDLLDQEPLAPNKANINRMTPSFTIRGRSRAWIGMLGGLAGLTLAFGAAAQAPVPAPSAPPSTRPIAPSAAYAWTYPTSASASISTVGGNVLVTVAGTATFRVIVEPRPTRLVFVLTSRLLEVSGTSVPAAFDAGDGSWKAVLDTTAVPNGIYYVGVRDDSVGPYSGSGAPFFLRVDNGGPVINRFIDALVATRLSTILGGTALLLVFISLVAFLAWKEHLPRTVVSPLIFLMVLLAASIAAALFLVAVALETRGADYVFTHPWEAGIFSFLLGVLFFRLATWPINRFERVAHSRWTDALRRSSLLFAWLAASAHSALVAYGPGGYPAYGWISSLFIGVSLGGIAVNALEMVHPEKRQWWALRRR